MVKIRLRRMGARKRPYYRIVVIDARKPRDGRALESIGYYHPVEAEDRQFSVQEDRVRYWLSVGAQPTNTIKRLLTKNKVTVKE